MILFPLIATWIWFQIFTASALLSSGRCVEDTHADVSSLRIPNVI
jgi:hypothetical protein